jgi:hypothetical protein
MEKTRIGGSHSFYTDRSATVTKLWQKGSPLETLNKENQSLDPQFLPLV